MVRDTQRLPDFEARYRREAYRGLKYEDSLAIFEALWVEAQALSPEMG